ncbi:Hsp20/alpha crystallin family protein [Kribbella sp. NPDC023855]|uniref:Hsp20/alpha crystallin family protein n=1 Tax=Kribbella sp. NPDC023855 TaxID=3154698 RepID=UPI0033F72BD1
MLVRTDPFQPFDRLAEQLAGASGRPAVVPMDAYRSGDEFVVVFDLPGVNPEAIDVSVERNVLTVRAERQPLQVGDDVQLQIAERPIGVFSRQLFLDDSLDTDNVEAGYEAGVLRLRIPVAPKPTSRKIEIGGSQKNQLNS